MQHYMLLSIAWLVLLVGIVLLFSPIPIGILFIGVGLSLLVSTSDAVALRLRGYRERNEKFSRQLNRIEDRLHRRLKFVRVAMHKTRPIVPSERDDPGPVN